MGTSWKCGSIPLISINGSTPIPPKHGFESRNRTNFIFMKIYAAPKNGMGRPTSNWEERNWLQPKSKKLRRAASKREIRKELINYEK